MKDLQGTRINGETWVSYQKAARIAAEVNDLVTALEEIASCRYVDDFCTIPVTVEHLQNAAREALERLE